MKSNSNLARELFCRQRSVKHQTKETEYSLVPVSKRVFVQNLSHENEFDLKENEPLGEIHFHMNGFTRGL